MTFLDSMFYWEIQNPDWKFKSVFPNQIHLLFNEVHCRILNRGLLEISSSFTFQARQFTGAGERDPENEVAHARENSERSERECVGVWSSLPVP